MGETTQTGFSIPPEGCSTDQQMFVFEALQLRWKVNISQLQGEFEFNTFLCDKPYK